MEKSNSSNQNHDNIHPLLCVTFVMLRSHTFQYILIANKL